MVWVTVTDRGPALRTGRDMDVSEGVAKRLGFREAGLARLDVWRYSDWVREVCEFRNLPNYKRKEGPDSREFTADGIVGHPLLGPPDLPVLDVCHGELRWAGFPWELREESPERIAPHFRNLRVVLLPEEGGFKLTD